MKNFVFKLTPDRGRKKLKLLRSQCSPIPRNSPVYLSKKTNMYMKLSMKHWFNDTDTGKLIYLVKNLYKCHSFHHNPHGS